MGHSNKIPIYAADYINGITYIGEIKREGDKGEIKLCQYVAVPTLDLVNSDKGYRAAAMEKLNKARGFYGKDLLESGVLLCPEGRITLSKLETIEIHD